MKRLLYFTSVHTITHAGAFGAFPRSCLLEDAIVNQERKIVQSAMMLGILLIIGFYHLLLTFREQGSDRVFFWILLLELRASGTC